MNTRLAALICSITTCFLLWSQLTLARPERSRVAVVRTDSDDRLLRDAGTRLRAELRSAGFEVVEVYRAPGDPRTEVESAGGRSGSFATVALHRAGSGALADVWISDHLTGKTVIRRIEVPGARNAATVLAIRALELLRASLLEVAAEPSPDNEPEHETPADVLEWIEPDLPQQARNPYDFFARTALGVSALGLHGRGDLGLAVGPSLRISHGLGGRWFGRLSLAAPLFGPEPERPEGRAAVRQEFASVDIGLATDAHPFGLFGWAGLGAFHLHTSGSAAAPYRATTDNVLSFLSNAGIGGMARVGERITLTLEIGALWLIPHPVIVIAGKDAGRAGVPSLQIAIGALVGL